MTTSPGTGSTESALAAEDCKMIIVMRVDLGMSVGKMVAQGAHAAAGLMRSLGPTDYSLWLANGLTKIVVRAESEAELNDIRQRARVAGLRVYPVSDAGRTEVEPGTLTCIGIGPQPAREVDKVTGGLRLL